MIEDTVVYASPGKRLVGFGVDAMVLLAAAVTLLWVTGVDMDAVASPGDFPRTFLFSVAVFSALYYIVPTKLVGQTLGKMAIRTRVVDATTGLMPSWPSAVVRWLIPAFALALPQVVGVWLLALIYGWVVVDGRHRGLHDLAGRTVVIDIDLTQRQNSE